jgi:hypothetical protein
VPKVFLLENRQTGAIVVFKADSVSQTGFQWAGYKLVGNVNYTTNLVWIAVFD